jgi:hypothetical protein
MTSKNTDQQQGGVSVASDSLDTLVEQASVPSLASLFRKAKDAGVIPQEGIPAYGPMANSSN